MATYTFDKIDYGGNTYVVQDSGALQLTGGTVTGPVTFGDSITVDEATLGDLVVNGNASFTNNIQANTINGVAVGSSPKFTDTVTTVTTSGSGNAITAISASNGAITATKGTTFLTSHNTYTISTTGSGNAVTAVSLSGTTFTVTKGATYSNNAGTITGVTAGTGLSGGGTSGSVTLNHSNSVTAQTTQAVYPIKIDAQGHISAYGSAVTIPDVSAYNKNKYSAGTGLAFAATDLPSGGLDITINHSNSVTAQTTQAVYPIKIDAQGHISAYGSAATILTIGTGASNAAAGNHTHTLSLALSNDTSTVALTSGTKYQLTAGGNSIIFTTPTDYKVENDPVTAATTFYPVGSTSDSTQTEMLVKHASIKFYTAANSGTDGSARLALGNATASSSAGGKKGVIRLYGTGSQYVDITPGNITTSRTITIPDATGTIALTSNLANYVPTSDVSTTGGASKIIKSDSEGNITITGHLSTSGGVVGEIKKDEPSAVSTTSGRYYKIAEVKLDPGVWVYTTTAEFAANTSGYRRAYTTTDSFSNGTSTAPTVIAKSLATNIAQAGGQVTHTHDAMIFTVTSATTYRLVAYQNGGSLSVTGRIYAVRIA